ncbi:hypothetical protein [Hymenobacter latericus]|uniref:hypothetical protein n=1 Tax=Hymenobacter sp. YIM 151858-1 TaxID=2987688 RepID=UPI002227700D|nr:hypothetical protein [Hymenobacter sp. YIM 151858-1]UYZ58122.1 hypothetical protein OIS50_13765 [Hymenobacter sp. YIM 151858-1]
MPIRLLILLAAAGLWLRPTTGRAQAQPRTAPDTISLEDAIGAHNERATRHNRMLAAYNEAQQHTQQAITQLNAFFDYYNHQFQPRKTDAQLQQMLPPVAASLQRARSILATVVFEDETRQASVRELTAVVHRAETRLRNSQAFLARYLRTSAAQRPVLFTTRGGPNEMTR